MRVMLLLLGLVLLPAPAQTQTNTDAFLGTWCLVTWEQSEVIGIDYEGELMIEPSGEGYRGELFINALDGGSFGHQALEISVEGSSLFAEGRMIDGRNWLADRLLLSLDDNHLNAVGRDLLPQQIRARFRRGECTNATS